MPHKSQFGDVFSINGLKRTNHMSLFVAIGPAQPWKPWKPGKILCATMTYTGSVHVGPYGADEWDPCVHTDIVAAMRLRDLIGEEVLNGAPAYVRDKDRCQQVSDLFRELAEEVRRGR